MKEVKCPCCGGQARICARTGNMVSYVCVNSWRCGYAWIVRE